MIIGKDIHRSFGKLEVLKGIDISINRGEIVSVVGPSGAGKSTLLQILGTLDRPTSGRVMFDDTDVFSLKSGQLAKFRNGNIGFVFQFHQLLPEFTLIENVAMPALIKGVGSKEAFTLARPIIQYLGLEHRADHKPGELSGGECQRAAVARALINKPKVILADEPSGSLDTANRRELHKLFFDIRRDMGATFVIVTHDENLAADTDRVIQMIDGQIVDK